MEDHQTEFENYVDHPRYGRGPRITGFEPQEDPERGILFWIYPPESRIPNTAIRANTDRQKITSFPIPYYFDQKKTCKDCNQPFIFFAEEQQFWFEELRFDLNADCIRCAPCREAHRLKTKKRSFPPTENQS
jgi:hypothetical protein